MLTAKTGIIIFISIIAVTAFGISYLDANDAGKASKDALLKEIDDLLIYLKDAEKKTLIRYTAKPLARQTEPYDAIVEMIDQTRKDMRDLTNDNAPLEERLNTLEPLVSQRLVMIRQLVDSLKNKEIESMAEVDVTGKTKEVLDNIESLIMDIRNVEARNEGARERERDRLLEKLKAKRSGRAGIDIIGIVITLGSSACALAIVIYSYSALLRRQTARRERAEEGLNLLKDMVNRYGDDIFVADPKTGSFTVRDITMRQKVEKALSNERQLIESITNSLFGIFYVFDDKDKAMKWNHSLEKISGYSAQELSKMSLVNLFAEADRKNIEEKTKEAVVTGRSFFEGNILSKGGVATPYLFTELRATIEETPCIIGMGIDISERKKMERVFQDAREYAEAIVEGVRESLLVLDANSRVITANRSYYDTFKVTQEGTKGKSLYELSGGQWEIAKLRELLEDVLVKHKRFHNFEVEKEFPDIGKRTMLLNARRIHRKDSSSQMILLAIDDITERKKAEEALLNEKQLIESIINSLPGIFYVLDNKGRMMMWNRSFETVLGYSGEDMPKMGLADFVAEEDRRKISERVEQALSKEKIFFEANLSPKEGNPVPYLFTELRAKIDNVPSVIGMAVDISEQKKMEKDLQDALRVKSYFTSMVSHELRTPLTSIKEGIGIMLDGITGEINEKQKKCLAIAKENVDRLVRLINDILDFQKMESGKVPFNIQEGNINDAIGDVYNVMLPLAAGKGLELSTRLTDNLPRIKFDKDKIIQVLTNLVNNAIKFTDKGGVKITSGLGDNFIQVSVDDTGPGIKAEDIPKLFQQFERLEREDCRRVEGTGLGLAISKEIIAKHNGKIWAESVVGKGTTVHFILPIIERRVWRRKDGTGEEIFR